jgi:hypothetical protein
VMFALTFVALHALLRDRSRGCMAVALTLALLGAAVFLATNSPFAMLSLSGRYAAAVTDAERSMLLAAAQSVLVSTHQRAVGGFNLALLLVSVAGIVVSWALYRSRALGRTTAWLGLLGNGLSIADYVRQVITQSALVALLLVIPGALLLSAWYVWVGVGLLRFGRAAPEPRDRSDSGKRV